jgi:hypothetical protein
LGRVAPGALPGPRASRAAAALVVRSLMSDHVR